jgi:hypothetical protein
MHQDNGAVTELLVVYSLVNDALNAVILPIKMSTYTTTLKPVFVRV